MKKFEGYYFKHQKNGKILAIIAGYSSKDSFIQIIAENISYFFSYPLAHMKKGKGLIIEHNCFSKRGIALNIEEQGLSIKGTIYYHNLTPLKYNIMGPFSLLPMECSHQILSMHHSLSGKLDFNGSTLDFRGGTGYIEGDCGFSFPKHYLWCHCNDFPQKCSITVSIADIPFAGFHFNGCIAVVWMNGREYRLATYLGVKILEWNESCLRIKQDYYYLEIYFKNTNGHELLAPVHGGMERKIKESVTCLASFRFYERGRILLRESYKLCSYEYV